MDVEPVSPFLASDQRGGGGCAKMCSLSVCLGERASEERAEREEERALSECIDLCCSSRRREKLQIISAMGSKGVEGSRSAGLGRYEAGPMLICVTVLLSLLTILPWVP